MPYRKLKHLNNPNILNKRNDLMVTRRPKNKYVLNKYLMIDANNGPDSIIGSQNNLLMIDANDEPHLTR